MIRFDSVTKTYRGGSRPALDGVSLEIGSGEFVFLVGASGSGKSSLLRLILREDRPTTGEIHVLGQRLTTISSRKVPYFRRTLGVVFQDFRLLPNKTVYANVAFTLQVIGKSRGFIQEAVPDVLRMVGLEDKARSLPTELSGGEQQRVAIARAVVNKPAVLLADEPTGNLDPTTSDGIMQVLATINASGTTVVMATHDVTIVDKMQRRVVELIDGRIVRDELEATYVTSAVPVQGARARPGSAASSTAPLTASRMSGAAETPVLTEPARTADTGTRQQQPVATRRETAEVMAPTDAAPAAAPAESDRPQAWLSRWLLTDEDEPQAAASDPAADDHVPAWSLAGGSAESRSNAPAAVTTDTARTDTVPADTVRSGTGDADTVRADTAPNPAPVRRWAVARTAPPTQTWAGPRSDSPGDRSTEASTQTSTETPTHPGPTAPRQRPPSASASPSASPPAARSAAGGDAPPVEADLSADLGLGLDTDARLRSNAKHRVPLPQHLDFLAGLGLREETEPEDPGTVGPSS